MLLSQQFKFILDENVRRELYFFLKENGFNVELCPKGISDRGLSLISEEEERILVTNDSDFESLYFTPKNKIFAIILLKISQSFPESLIKAFASLLKEKNKIEDFAGKIIVLKEGEFEVCE